MSQSLTIFHYIINKIFHKQLFMQELSLKSFDSNPASINLNYNKIQQHRSKTGGLFSLCYIIVALVIIVFKLRDLAARNHLTYVEHVIKEEDLEPLNIASGKFRFTFYQRIGKKANRIKFQERFQKGINVSIAEYNILMNDSKQVDNFTMYPMVSCPQSDGIQYEYYFCSPPHTQLNQLNYSVFGRVDFPLLNRSAKGIVYRQYQFIVQPCDNNFPQCQQYKDNVIPFFQIYNAQIFPNQTEHSKTINKSSQIRKFESLVTLRKNQLTVFQLDFQKIKIRTENSILPQIFNSDSKDFQQSSTQFFDEDKEQHYSLHQQQDDQTMFAVQIRRSIYTREYVRKYMKLDFVLAEIFGLFGLFSLIFYGVYRGYNQYSLEQNIRKDLGLPYDKNTNLVRYYWNIITKFLYKWFPCFFKNNERYLQQKKSLLKICKKLDVSTLKHENLHRRFIQYT